MRIASLVGQMNLHVSPAMPYMQLPSRRKGTSFCVLIRLAKVKFGVDGVEGGYYYDKANV